MTLLAMLRHGETEWSRAGRLQGRTDISLNETGRQAMLLRRLPEQCRGMRAVTSPLRRCIETAALLGLTNAVHENRIAEMSWGAWEGRSLSDLRAELGDEMVRNEALGFDFTPLRGESPRQVLQRVREWLVELASSGEDTLAVSHRGVIRVIFAAACDWNMQGRPPAKLDWNALHLFQLDRSGNPSVWRLNLPLVPLPPNEVDA